MILRAKSRPPKSEPIFRNRRAPISRAVNMIGYDFYLSEYGGFLIPENRFPYYESKAAAYVDAVSFGRVTGCSLSEDELRAVGFAVCDAAEYYYFTGENKQASSGISSEKVGDYTVSYSSSASSAGKNAEDDLKRLIKNRLAGSGLLYRGDDLDYQ